MTFPTLAEAKELFDYACQQTDVINLRNGLSEGISRRHYLQVAENARLIAAETPSLNPEKAYILGLLHDYGEFSEQKNKNCFHGTSGFDDMNNLGYDEIANACLTHSFFDEDISTKNYPSYNADCIIRAAKIIGNRVFNIYEKLVQLSDLMVAGDKLVTIEERLDFIKQKYHISAKKMEKKKQKALELKELFDFLCGKDVYQILKVKND